MNKKHFQREKKRKARIIFIYQPEHDTRAPGRTIDGGLSQEENLAAPSSLAQRPSSCHAATGCCWLE